MGALHYTDGQHTAFAEYFLSAGVDMNKLANICLGNVHLAQWLYCYLGKSCTYVQENEELLLSARVSLKQIQDAVANDVRAEQWLLDQAEKWATMSYVLESSKPASTRESLSAARIKHATGEPTVGKPKRLVFGLALFEAMMTHNEQAQQCVLRGETSHATDELQAQQLLGAILRRDILRTKQQQDMMAERTPTEQGSYVATNKKLLADSYAECSRLLARYCASHARLADEVLLANLPDDDEPVGELPPQ